MTTPADTPSTAAAAGTARPARPSNPGADAPVASYLTTARS